MHTGVLKDEPLTATLTRLGLTQGPPWTGSFVEALSTSLDWTQAGPLFHALRTPITTARTPTLPRHHPEDPGPALAAEIEGLRRTLRDLGPLGLPATPARQHARGPRSDPARAEEPAPDASDWRRHYAHRQQAMEAAVAAWRESLRLALAQRGERGARLAAIDAVLERAVTPREDATLSALPLMAERLHTLRVGSSAPSEAGLATLARDLPRLLLAELELRLQPVWGLLEALQASLNDDTDDAHDETQAH